MSITVSFFSEYNKLNAEFTNVIRAFNPHVIIKEDASKIVLKFNLQGDKIHCIIDHDDSICEYSYSVDLLERQKNQNYELSCYKKYGKIALYNYLVKLTGITLPYGSLTGIRPTKLYYEIQEDNKNAHQQLKQDYSVSEKKLQLIETIIRSQDGIYNQQKDKIGLFINIPICLTKCSYCSFASIERCKLPKNVLSKYVECLQEEIKQFNRMFSASDIRSIYIGGGTPTSLTTKELDSILQHIIKPQNVEFTVEGGRPDTLDKEKLMLLKRYQVNRLSVNPQSFSDSTLKLIRRTHTVDDIYKVYAMAREIGFDINMDIIAMLPQESFSDFKQSVDKAIELQPENITVHTLALKRGSALLNAGHNNKDDNLAREMVDYSIEKLTASGYSPYYMYRLKNMSGGLENVGYARENKQCIYNIDIMEETHSIYAIGSGGISKKVMGDLLNRYAVSKDIYYYIDNFDRIMEEKKSFFKSK